jgi:AFG3 family protein
MAMTLGGRAAEEVFFEKISTGAQNDLERVTKMAYNMIAIYGMNEKVGLVSFYDPNGEYAYQRPYSEKTAELIDLEARMMINESYARVKELLVSKKKEVAILAEELLKKELLFQSDLEGLIGKRPYDQKTTFEDYMDEGNDNKEKITSVEETPVIAEEIKPEEEKVEDVVEQETQTNDKIEQDEDINKSDIV